MAEVKLIGPNASEIDDGTSRLQRDMYLKLYALLDKIYVDEHLRPRR